MMNEWKLRVALVAGVCIYLAFIFFLLKKNKLSVRFSIVWFASGMVMLVFALFPYVVLVLGDIFRVINPVNFVFLLLFVFVLFILLSLSSAISSLDNKNKQLAQKAALLEERVRQLEPARQTQQSNNGNTPYESVAPANTPPHHHEDEEN
ncbi:DUF2304 domain-containing protein [Ruminococcaceae bacterium OttesenSCG-928-N02]|nr:DUF2304 domain-containing protein [Ruminococcaceae bacterium OttesenSCG-928-N02]